MVNITRDGKSITVLPKEIKKTDTINESGISIKHTKDGVHIFPITWAERVRRCFVAPQDFYMSENDGAGLQVRIVASISQDPVMVDIFQNLGGDIHSRTGQNIFKKEIPLNEFITKKKSDKEIKDARQNGKTCNLSLLFGASGYAFAKDSLVPNWSLDEAKKYVADNGLLKKQQSLFKLQTEDESYDPEISPVDLQSMDDKEEFSWYWAASSDIRKKFMELYQGLDQWHTDVKEFALENGWVRSVWGPFRRLPELLGLGKDDKGIKEKGLFNESLNSPIQAWEATWMYRGMLYMHREFKKRGMKTYISGNIHDSIILYIHKDEFKEFSQIVKEAYELPIPEARGIPFDIERAFVDNRTLFDEIQTEINDIKPTDNLLPGVWGVREFDFYL